LIWHILKKDWKLLWPLVALCIAIQFGLEWVVFSAGLFGEDPAAAVLLRPLMLAWFVAIAAPAIAVVHQDSIPGVDQDWLIRPLRRTHLLLAKLVFAALTIIAPMFLANMLDALATGFPLLLSLKALLLKELFVFACFVVPSMALAALARNAAELVVLGAALMVVFAVALSLSALLSGSDWCPTCNSGMSWLQHVVQHIGILIGAGVILYLQYYRRRSDVARAVAILGAVALVFAQLPWSSAFALERCMTGSSGAATVVGLEFGEPAPSARPTAPPMRGRVDQAVGYLRRRARPGDAPVSIDLPVHAIGATADELVLADRIDIRLFGDDARLLYSGDNAGSLAGLLSPYPGASNSVPAETYQAVDLPGVAYRQAAATAARLQLDYSLTLVRLEAEHRLAAVAGAIHSADVGICATSFDRNSLYLRCKTVIQAPFCFSAVLVGPDGRHNPEVLKCIPDYRRHLPTFMNALGFYGVDLPLRDRNGVAHYDIDASQLGTSQVLFKVYQESEHFKRRLTVATSQLDRWRVQTE